MATVSELINKIGYEIDQTQLAKVHKSRENLKKSFMNTATVIGGILGSQAISKGFDSIVEGIKSVISTASGVEMATAQFQTLLGSLEKANKLVGDIRKTASSTPFQFGSLKDASTILLSFGAATEENVIEKLRTIGDLSQGNSENLLSISRAYGKVQTKGKASMEEINTISDRGVPIFKELENITGATGDSLFSMISKGEISSDIISQAFINMTSEGGKFYKGMETASLTLEGKFSTFKDKINDIKMILGNQLLPIIKEVLDKLIDKLDEINVFLTENEDKIELLSSAFAVMLEVLLELLPVFTPLLGFLGLVIVFITILNAKLLLMNILAFPISGSFLLIAGAIALVVGILIKFRKHILDVLPISDELKEVIKGAVAGFKEFFKTLGSGEKKITKVGRVIEILGQVIKQMIKTTLGNLKILFIPFSTLLGFIENIFLRWDDIKKAFTDGGIVEGIKEIGKALLDALIKPFTEFKDNVLGFFNIFDKNDTSKDAKETAEATDKIEADTKKTADNVSNTNTHLEQTNNITMNGGTKSQGKELGTLITDKFALQLRQIRLTGAGI